MQDLVPRETPQVRVVKMPHSIEDPLVKGIQFSFGGWIYLVYDERSRRRKFIQRIGKIELIEPEQVPEEEVEEDYEPVESEVNIPNG